MFSLVCSMAVDLHGSIGLIDYSCVRWVNGNSVYNEKYSSNWKTIKYFFTKA